MASGVKTSCNSVQRSRWDGS